MSGGGAGSTLPVAVRWWRSEDLGDGITRLWEPAVHELIQANVFFVKGRERDLLVDSGNGLASLRLELEGAGLIDKPIVAVATHSHFDHIGSLHEFEDRRIHAAEADQLAQVGDPLVIRSSDFPDDFIDSLKTHGMTLPPLLLDAAPKAGFHPAEVGTLPAPATATLDDGDRIGLGDRTYEVLHLPGHSPGGVGLWEVESGHLFAGDAVYPGVLLDEAIPGADIAQYVRTMRRLRELPVTRVFGGHDAPFGRREMLRVIDAYLAHRGSTADRS